MTRISEPAAAVQAGTPQPQGRLHTLQAKLLIPIVGLMIASLLLSTVAFVVGTTRTQDQLLEQQIQADVQRVQQALIARADQMNTAVRMLANDPIVNEAIRSAADEALATLNDRAVVVRDRLGADLIQIYNQAGSARTNLAAAGLYQTSALLGEIGDDATGLVTADDKLLLLSQAACPGNVCTIIFQQSGNGRFAQVAGLRYVWDPSKPIGSRVWRVEVKEGNVWQPISPTKVYRVVSNDFMRKGGDGYTVFLHSIKPRWII